MKVIRLILDQSPPTLPQAGGWSDDFRNFVNACLQKDPRERPDIEALLLQHTTFLGKARDQEYIKTNLMNTLPPLEQRLGPELAAHGEEFLNTLQSQQAKPRKSKINFDFGSSSAD